MKGFTDTSVRGWVFKLILANVIFFAIQIFTEDNIVIYTAGEFKNKTSLMTYFMGLIPAMITEKGFVWQIFSYMFLHSTHSFIHIFFNMYALLIFGIPIEQTWGSKRFLFYYFFCGVGAGITIFFINLFSSGIGYYIPTIGASGAVFGMLLAFGILFPDTELLLFFFLPIKAKYLVVLYGLLELYLEVFGGPSNVSHIGHLGGLLFGLIYFFVFQKRRIAFKGKIAKVKMQKKFKNYESAVKTRTTEVTDDKKALKLKILNSLRTSGIDSLSDDDFQFINYLKIMIEEEDFECHRDYDEESGYCQDCTDYDICFLREVKKYLKN